MTDSVRALRRQKVIAALLTERTVTDAARSLNMSERQVGRYMADPEFKQALKEAEQAALSGLVRSLVALGEKAAAALEDALAPDQKQENRIRAADITLRQLSGYYGLLNLEERLAALEEAVNAGRG